MIQVPGTRSTSTSTWYKYSALQNEYCTWQVVDHISYILVQVLCMQLELQLELQLQRCMLHTSSEDTWYIVLECDYKQYDIHRREPPARVKFMCTTSRHHQCWDMWRSGGWRCTPPSMKPFLETWSTCTVPGTSSLHRVDTLLESTPSRYPTIVDTFGP